MEENLQSEVKNDDVSCDLNQDLVVEWDFKIDVNENTQETAMYCNIPWEGIN